MLRSRQIGSVRGYTSKQGRPEGADKTGEIRKIVIRTTHISELTVDSNADARELERLLYYCLVMVLIIIIHTLIT